jgi:hypothetical protein
MNSIGTLVDFVNKNAPEDLGRRRQSGDSLTAPARRGFAHIVARIERVEGAKKRFLHI